MPRADALNWELPSSNGLPSRIHRREPQHQTIQPVEPGTEAAVREQIASLLGDADAPDHWSSRSLQLTEPEGQATGMEVSLQPVTADPSEPTGWRCDPSASTRYPGLIRLPACWYISNGSAFGNGDLPHLGLAYQCLNHCRCKNEYEELLSPIALPVGVRKGMVDAQGNSTAGPVVLAPNTCMDLPAEASFEFVEIRARSLAEHRAWRQSLDETMRRNALIPSSSSGDSARTELEISLTASQSYALLQSLAIQKASLFSTLLEHWVSLTGESIYTGQICKCR